MNLLGSRMMLGELSSCKLFRRVLLVDMLMLLLQSHLLHLHLLHLLHLLCLNHLLRHGGDLRSAGWLRCHHCLVRMLKHWLLYRMLLRNHLWHCWHMRRNLGHVVRHLEVRRLGHPGAGGNGLVGTQGTGRSLLSAAASGCQGLLCANPISEVIFHQNCHGQQRMRMNRITYLNTEFTCSRHVITFSSVNVDRHMSKFLIKALFI